MNPKWLLGMTFGRLIVPTLLRTAPSPFGAIMLVYAFSMPVLICVSVTALAGNSEKAATSTPVRRGFLLRSRWGPGAKPFKECASRKPSRLREAQQRRPLRTLPCKRKTSCI